MKLLIIDDERVFLVSVSRTLTRAGYQALGATSVKEAKHLIVAEEPDIVLLDINLPDGNGIDLLKWAKNSFPDLMFVMITARGNVSDAVDAMRCGAYDYLEKPVDLESLVERINRVKEVIGLKRALWRFNKMEETAEPVVISESQAMLEVTRLAHTVAESGARAILLEGESGCGKDLLARFIHAHSNRRAQPFMVINCAALPETLLESELFGHEKGAFTDAKIQKRGILELADEGTVLLDEIGEMPLSMQSKILRVLEDWTFRRVGGTRDISVNVRVIAATNQNLGKMVEEKRFRDDLFYRLNVFPIQVPPLRERPEDVLALAQKFVIFYNKSFGKNVLGFTKEAEASLVAYPWPGNVRELKNVVERTMILQTAPYVDSTDLLLKKSEIESDSNLLRGILALPDAERILIRRALALTRGNVLQAAKVLHITRDKLRYKMKKLQMQS